MFPHLNPNPVKISDAPYEAGAYNLKKVLPSYRDANHLKSTFQRELWSEAGTWLLERTQTLWDDGMPDEASALYSEFSRGPALSE